MAKAKTSKECPEEIKKEKHRVKLTLEEPMLGTVPKNKEVYKAHILTKIPEGEKLPDQIEEVDSIEELEERGWTGFHMSDGKPFIFNYMTKGQLKASADALRDQSGVAALESKVTKYVAVHPRKIFFDMSEALDDAALRECLPPVTFPDEAMRKIGATMPYLERPLRAKTMQGPRVTLVRSDVIPPGATLTFDLTIIKNKWLNEKVVRYLFQYGEFCGLGQWRTADFGKFSFEMEKIEDNFSAEEAAEALQEAHENK